MLQDFLALPKSWSLKMYIETWTKFGFPSLIFNTLLYTFCTVILVVLIAPMAAYKLARTKNRLSKVCFVLIIMPMMVPFQSYMITLTRLVSNVKLTGTRTGYILVSVGLCMPLAVYMIHGFVKNVPIDLEECACIDGAGKIRTYFSIVLPLLKPIMLYTLVTSAIGGLQMYDIPALFNVPETGLVGLPDDKTTTMAMYIMRLYNSDVGKAAAVSVILFAVTLIVSLILFASMSDKDERRIKKARKAGGKR